MTETAMSAQAAVAEIQRLETWRRPLELRTSGIAWMIWGLTSTGIFVTYNYFGVVGAYLAKEALYLMPVLWMPWVAMGVLATRALYKSAGVFFPKFGNPREGFVISAVFVVIMFTGFGIASALNFPIVEPAMYLGLVGIASVVLGSTGYACVDQVERRLHLGGGAVLAFIAFAPAPFIPTREMAYALYASIAPLTTAIVYFGIGLYMTRRG